MKNKNLLSLLAFALISLFTVTMTSCGDDDPQPVVPNPTQKTDLEKVKEAITGSVWNLQSADVISNGKTYHYNADCDFKAFPSTLIATNATDFKYSFTGTTLTYTEHCGTQTKSNVAYTIEQNGGVFTLSYGHGDAIPAPVLKFELITPVNDLKGSTIKVKRTTLNGDATSATLVFTK